MPKSCQNGNESTFWQNKWQLVHIQTQTYHYPLHTHMHAHHRYSPYTHTYDHRSSHTHIMSIDHLHTYEHIIHIHMNTSLHGQLTEMRDQSRERWKGEVRARPETFLYYLCNIQGKFYMLQMLNG